MRFSSPVFGKLRRFPAVQHAAILLAGWLACGSTAFSQSNEASEKESNPGPYTIDALPVPEEVRGQVTSIDFTPDGDTLLLARDGRIWIRKKGADADWKPWSVHGLEGATGLFAGYFPKSVYVVHATGITRLFDTTEDGTADFVKSVIPAWRFGTLGELFRGSPAVLPEGDLLLSPNVRTGAWSGLVMRVPEATGVSPWMTGFARISAPAIGPDGGWVLAGVPKSAEPNQEDTKSESPPGAELPAAIWMLAPEVEEPERSELAETEETESDSVSDSESAEKPEKNDEPDTSASPEESGPIIAGAPAIYLPKSLMPTAPIRPAFPAIGARGKRFGVFSGQGFVAGENSKRLLRLMPEWVDGIWQGAVSDFAAIESTDPGINFLEFSPDGRQLLAGEGGQVLRIQPAGGAIFAVHSIHLATDGIEIRFTRAINRAKAADLKNWKIRSGLPGSPATDFGTFSFPTDTRVILDFDGLAATAQFSPEVLETGKIYDFDLSAITSESGETLSHGPVFYTLHRLPEPPAPLIPPSDTEGSPDEKPGQEEGETSDQEPSSEDSKKVEED